MFFKLETKMLIVTLLISCLVIIDAAYQQCNIICQDDQHPPQSGPPGNPVIGKAGPKGEKGDAGVAGVASCTCPSSDDILEEIAKIKAELAGMWRKPHDCYEIKKIDPNAASGLYQIFPTFNLTLGYQVYCDMDTDGGGWIVFQNRQDGTEEFYRNWDDYVHGFGDLNSEFWMGLELVHKLTTNGKFELRVDLADFENNNVYQHYSDFSISAGTDYALDFGETTGTAGDSLYKAKFTTKDRDQDSYSQNCATVYFGAWWYKSCHRSNLNGRYLGGKTDEYATGMVWYTWKGYHYTLKSSQLKFRPTV